MSVQPVKDFLTIKENKYGGTIGKQREIAWRRYLVAKYFTEGHYTPAEVRDLLDENHEIDYSVSTICRDIQQIQRDLNKETADMIRKHVVSGYEMLFQEALSSWFQSKEPRVVQRIKHGENAKGYYEEVVEKVEERDGNPSHWSNAERALRAVREIWGIDAPEQIEVSVKREIELIIQVLEDKMSPPAFEELVKILMDADIG